jgi:ribosomal protein L30/L7E
VRRTGKAKKKRGKHRRTAPRQFQKKQRRGDWLVKQVGSRIGTTPEQHETLVDLGLGKIGRSALFDGDDKGAWGQIEKVQHLVSARPLVRPADPHPLYGERWMNKPEESRYTVDGLEARHYDFDGDSFLAIEPYDGGRFSVNWSTGLPIATVLERIGRGLLERVSTCTVFDPTLPGHREVSIEKLLTMSCRAQVDFPFVRLETDDLTLVWRRPAYPKHVDEDVGAGRIGVVCRRLDTETLTGLVRATATPPVGEHLDELMSQVATVSDPKAA